jgi:PTK7 protein tyrosine kinase 7
MPVRWVCPLAASTRVYSAKSDVYSFGVLVWEVYNHGATPYGELLAAEVLLRVRSGHRLKWSKGALGSEAIRDLVARCTALDVPTRPLMPAVVEELTGTFDETGGRVLRRQSSSANSETQLVILDDHRISDETAL